EPGACAPLIRSKRPPGPHARPCGAYMKAAPGKDEDFGKTRVRYFDASRGLNAGVSPARRDAIDVSRRSPKNKALPPRRTYRRVIGFVAAETAFVQPALSA